MKIWVLALTLKTVFTSGPLAAYWLFALGALFVIVTLALPKGILGLWEQARDRLRRAPAAGPSTAEAGKAA